MIVLPLSWGREETMSDKDVRAASESFYAALNRMLNGNAASLADIWSHSADVTTQHPIGGREVGWDTVRNTWEQVAAVSRDGKVALADQRIQLGGDTAIETGVEKGSFSMAGQSIPVEGRVTNVYRRHNGTWKIVHHHADLSAAMVAAVGSLKK
jgi:ketosteroid isomerase-like protein